MTDLQQIKQVSAQIYLTLDNPASVRQQLKRINQAQQKLREFKQEINSTGRANAATTKRFWFR